MKTKYNIVLNLEKYEQTVLKILAHCGSEKIFKKLFPLLKDILLVKNDVYKVIYEEIDNIKVDKEILKNKYEKYKELMYLI